MVISMAPWFSWYRSADIMAKVKAAILVTKSGWLHASSGIRSSSM